MIVEIVPEGGPLAGPPIRVAASQVVVRQDNGTPIAAAAHYGPARTYLVSSAGREDFDRTLRDLGVHETVIVDTVRIDRPPTGARLVAGPGRPSRS